MARPSTTTPYGPPVPSSVKAGAGSTTPADQPVPADLNDSWRNLMGALGRGLPYHLNRAVRIVNLGHGWSR